MFTKNHSKKYYTDTHPKKGFGWLYEKSKPLYEIIMTIYYNARSGVLLLAFLVYLYYIIIGNLYGILIMAAISFSPKDSKHRTNNPLTRLNKKDKK